ncbi:MAG: membrane protein insertase YidC [Fimbriimonadaceae bacterium]
MSKNAPKKQPGKPVGKPATGRPAPKQPSWLLIVLWTFSVFFILRSCNQTPAGPKPTIDQYLSYIHTNAAKLADHTASVQLNDGLVPEINDAESNIDNLVKKGKLSPADAANQKHDLDTKLMEGVIVVADGLLRGAEQTVINGVLVPRNLDHGQLVPFKDFSYDKYQQAYQLLDNYQKRFGDTGLWQREFTVEDFNGKKTDYNGVQLHQKARDELSALSEHKPILGVIPGYQFIDLLVKVTGRAPGFSYWFAALLLALVVRSLIWPLSQKQLMWGRQMSQLAPMLREIKEKNKEPTVQQKKTMELYREYGLNPFAGCWPALVQLPLFLVVYQCMLHYRFEFQKGTFLWINAQVSHSTHGFTASDLGEKDTVLIIIYAVTLLISTLLTPVNDPTQVKQQRTIGIGVALMFPVFMITGTYPVPAAFVLYWTFTNVLATIQSLRAYYLLPAPPLVKVNTGVGGVFPTERKVGWWDKLQQQMQAQVEEKQRLTEEQAKRIEKKNDEDPPSGARPTNGKPATNPKPPSGGKQKPKRRTP